MNLLDFSGEPFEGWNDLVKTHGCPECDVLVMPGCTYICEHGVTKNSPVVWSITTKFKADANFMHRLYGEFD